MRVLILGEGENDLGVGSRDGIPHTPGVLPVFVRRLLDDPATEIHIRQWRSIRLNPDGARARGLDAKLKAVSQDRDGRAADCIVAVVDRDGPKNDAKRVQLENGREALAAVRKACAVGLAIETIEAWLLADVKGLHRGLSDATIDTQPDPESQWSSDRKSKKHPKIRLRRIIDQLNAASVRVEGGYSAHYARIAEHADLAMIEKRCPKGFAPFAAQVRVLAGNS